MREGSAHGRRVLAALLVALAHAAVQCGGHQAPPGDEGIRRPPLTPRSLSLSSRHFLRRHHTLRPDEAAAARRVAAEKSHSLKAAAPDAVASRERKGLWALSDAAARRTSPAPPLPPLPPPAPASASASNRKRKWKAKEVPGLPKWWVRRSANEGEQYGLDKDDVLRQHLPPRLDCEAPAPEYRFYVYPLEVPGRCQHLDARNLTSGLFKSLGSHSQWLDEVFFYHQMLDHPWRTEDPEEAFLFYVPILASLSSTGLCGDWESNMRHVRQALEASPYYQRHQGADHLMFATDKNIREYTFRNPGFAHLLRNFVVGRQLYWVSEFPDQCSIAVPHSCQMAAKGRCGYRDGDAGGKGTKLWCESTRQPEATFEEFQQRRNYTLFCMGQADDRPTHKSRKLAIDMLSGLRGPNYLLGVGVQPAKWRRKCKSPEDVSSCHFSNNPNANWSYIKYRDGLSLSKLAIFARGDDPASSRMYDALELGTPQILLSDLYKDIVAAFPCHVDWDRLVHQISEREFQRDPAGVMAGALDQLLGPVGTAPQQQVGFQRMWDAQKSFRDDLLWHTPGSRVGQNLLEEIGRRCTSGPRQAVWDDYTRRAAARLQSS